MYTYILIIMELKEYDKGISHISSKLHMNIYSNNGRHPVTKNFTPLHCTQPHFTPLHCTQPHFTPLHCTQPHFTPLHNCQQNIRSYLYFLMHPTPFPYSVILIILDVFRLK
jgi:hypothetical protein